MPMFRMRSVPYEGRRLVGSLADIQDVVAWIVSYGLPLLVDPYPSVEPFSGARMVDKDGVRHTPGVYIDPVKGTLIIRNKYSQVLEGDHGDWVMRDIVNNNFVIAKTPTIGTLYIPEI